MAVFFRTLPENLYYETYPFGLTPKMDLVGRLVVLCHFESQVLLPYQVIYGSICQISLDGLAFSGKRTAFQDEIIGHIPVSDPEFVPELVHSYLGVSGIITDGVLAFHHKPYVIVPGELFHIEIVAAGQNGQPRERSYQEYCAVRTCICGFEYMHLFHLVLFCL